MIDTGFEIAHVPTLRWLAATGRTCHVNVDMVKVKGYAMNWEAGGIFVPFMFFWFQQGSLVAHAAFSGVLESVHLAEIHVLSRFGTSIYLASGAAQRSSQVNHIKMWLAALEHEPGLLF